MKSLRKQAGAMVVEYALVLLLFLMLLLGIMEFGRFLFTLNAAAEATRWGARLAVVCDMNDPDIKTRMRSILNVEASNISILYKPYGCVAEVPDPPDASVACESVTVLLGQVTDGPDGESVSSRPGFTPLIPMQGVMVNLPFFRTTLLRESMASSNNDVCQ